MEQISVEELRNALPDGAKKAITPTVMQAVNDVLHEPEVHESYRENLLGYTQVLQKGRFKLKNYVNAVKFVSYKLLGKTSKEAYKLVYPDKIKEWTSQGVEVKDQASYISAYNSSKLVSLIYEQTLIPVHVLNRDNYQLAINTQVELMMTANSEMVRMQAANSILTQLKPPEVTQIDVNIKSDADSAIDALAKTTQQLVAQQKLALQSGVVSATDVAKQKLVTDQNDEIEDADFTNINDSLVQPVAQAPAQPVVANKNIFL